MPSMRSLENYIPDPAQLLPSHLRHQFLPGHTNDNKPIVVRTITGIVTEQDMEIAKTFLQAEHEFLLTFTHSPFLVHNTSYFCGDTPPPIKMRGEEEVPLVGIICMGYVDVLGQFVKYPIPIPACLQYAINVCEALVEVHQRMLAHRNVNPTTIVVHETGEAHLDGLHLAYNCVTDLSFTIDTTNIPSTEINIDTHKLPKLEFEGGTGCLNYISPEHTGRVHNKPDQRSDMYSLGVVIYEMLTGSVPFRYNDPLEMIHAHIARPPPPLPSELSSLGELVHILLAKDPDQRYLTAIGLKADLIKCRDLVTKHGKIKPFPLRKQDFIASPRIGGGLIGRQDELSLISSAIDEISKSSAVVLISGSAGVGKTALVNGLLKEIQAKGLYGTGKFDEYHATTKFFGVITSSIKNLFSQSISRSSSNINEWKKKLRQVVAGCENMFLDMFPQMEVYVEAPPLAELLAPAERKYRMHTMIADLVAMLSTISPLTLFFDDLQWADSASLELIEVVSNASEANILIIGTYRELNPELKNTLDSMTATKKDKCIWLNLTPFDENAVLDLLCESMQDEREHLVDLAKVIHSKTMGNTLFVIQFLAILYRRALIHFDCDLQRWVWDIKEIDQLGHTDGLVTFFLNIFRDLQAESLNLLTFASLLGNKFNANVVSHFAKAFNFPGVVPALNEATKSGFLVYLGKEEYSFIHDKIRQSAYELSSDKLRQRVYYEVGVYLLNSDDEDSAVTSLLYLKHVFPQLLANAIDSEECQKSLRRATSYALKAGIAAKTASAYQSALEYLKLGCNMLIPNDWETDNTLAYTLTLAYAECMYLCGFHDEALKEFAKLLDQHLSISQKVGVYQIQMQVLSNAVNYAEGMRVGLACCSLLGFEAGDAEEGIQTCHELIKSMDLHNVFHMPQLADTNLSLLMDVLGSLLMVAYFADKNLFMIAASEMVRITLIHGPSSSCPLGLVFFAMSYGLKFSSTAKAYQLGKLAVDLYKRFPVNSIKCKVHFVFIFSNPWRNHISDNLNYLLSAIQTAQAVGDYFYKAYCILHIPNTMLYIGRNVQEVLAEVQIQRKSMSQKGRYDTVLLFEVAAGYASLLAGLTLGEDTFTTQDGVIDEDSYLPSKNNGPVVNTWFEGLKIEALYMFGFHEEAIERGGPYTNMLGSLVGHPHEPRGMVYYILSLLAALPSHFEIDVTVSESSPTLSFHSSGLFGTEKPSQEEYDRVINQATDLCKHIDLWVKNSAINFIHYDTLIKAELARVQGKLQNALMLYDKAAMQARNNAYMYIEALSHELATRCFADAGMIGCAELTVKKALEGYSYWGAVQKVKQVRRKFSYLLPNMASPSSSSTTMEQPNVTPSGFQTEEITHAKTRELDMRTIIKANHVLSKEIALPQLLQKFVNIVLENVGAEQAAIVLNDVDERSSWRVASSWSVHDEHLDKNKAQTSMHMEGARKNIVDYVLHTRRPMAIDSFTKSDFYDPLQGMEIGSVLCVPIGLKGLVCGAVYLEHSVPRVLQEDRLELMRLLCTQLYISIDNAKLYNSIQSSEHRYKTLAEGLPIMAFSRDSAGGTFANSKLLQFFGLPSDRAESVILDQVIERIHKEDTEIFMDAWNSAVDPTCSPVEVEMRVQRASDSDFRWTLCHVTPSFDSQNRAEMLLATWMDIQDLKDAQAEQLKKAEIEASEQKYRSLAEAIPQIVWTSPHDGDVNYFNKRWYEFTGLTEAESLGQAYMSAFHPQDVHVWPVLLNIQANFEVKLRIKTKDGAYRWHLARAILASGGKKFGTFTDIEDQAQTEMSLKIARETAEKAAHNQAFFVANMSHEIRTPMNGLLGMLHLLLETELTEEQRDYGDTMQRSADSLLRIIDDVLDFSKIQEGKLELREEVINVEAILEDVIETISILAVAAELIFYVHRDVPTRLIGDPGKLRQVIMNLVGNAVKFTPSGEIFVSCAVQQWQGGNVLLRFEVSDTGEGIGAEKQQGLFTPFYQADSSSTRAHGGTGLGLAICKQLVALFHGEITVKSTVGEGSTFIFSASFKIAPEQSPRPPPFPAQWRALLVSNLPVSLTVLQNHLQTCGIPYTSTTSQEGAMEILRNDQQASKEREATGQMRGGINCVILDLFAHLEMHADFQRCLPYLGGKHLVLVVSSLQRPNLLREFPYASFLLKPVTTHKFVDALLGRSVLSKGRLVMERLTYQGSAQVLIVEDNKVNQKVLASFLSKCKVPYSIANNGLEAFQMVKEKPLGYFSLILLDLAMPVWDGFRACTEIRNLENGMYRHPIIALTANVQDGVLDSCKTAGMDDFVSKPVDFKLLSAMLNNYLCSPPNIVQ